MLRIQLIWYSLIRIFITRNPPLKALVPSPAPESLTLKFQLSSRTCRGHSLGMAYIVPDCTVTCCCFCFILLLSHLMQAAFWPPWVFSLGRDGLCTSLSTTFLQVKSVRACGACVTGSFTCFGITTVYWLHSSLVRWKFCFFVHVWLGELIFCCFGRACSLGEKNQTVVWCCACKLVSTSLKKLFWINIKEAKCLVWDYNWWWEHFQLLFNWGSYLKTYLSLEGLVRGDELLICFAFCCAWELVGEKAVLQPKPCPCITCSRYTVFFIWTEKLMRTHFISSIKPISTLCLNLTQVQW